MFRERYAAGGSTMARPAAATVLLAVSALHDELRGGWQRQMRAQCDASRCANCRSDRVQLQWRVEVCGGAVRALATIECSSGAAS
jgi:hypothetical protein